MDNHHHAIHLGAVWEAPIPAADGGAVWTRRFGRPTGLGPGDRAFLVITRPTIAAGVTINTVPLPPLTAGVERWSHDVTPLLRDRNDLALVLAAAAADVHHAVQGRGPLPLAVGRVDLEIVPAVPGAAGSRGSPAGRSA